MQQSARIFMIINKNQNQNVHGCQDEKYRNSCCYKTRHLVFATYCLSIQKYVTLSKQLIFQLQEFFGLVSWHPIAIDIRNSRSSNIFKTRIRSQNEKRLLFYNASSRIGQIVQARMHMNSSCLNEHIVRRSLVDGPNCACEQIVKQSFPTFSS